MMPKMVIDENLLYDFSDILRDVIFDIKSETYKKNMDREKIVKLLDQLHKEWAEVYNPMERTIKQSKRSVYSQYIKAKKAGDQEKAQEYLSLYLKFKEL